MRDSSSGSLNLQSIAIQPNIEVCQGISCDLEPLTAKPAVTTVLLTLGGEANKQLVVGGATSQLIVETVVRLSTPQKNPKILIVQDQDIGGEDPEDTAYLKNVLLSRYVIDFILEPSTGLTSEMLMGYDLIWFNNPGHPMTSSKTRDALIAFAGGVVLQGDDLSKGASFDLSALTGLKYIDNGTQVMCAGQSFTHDNNQHHQFGVRLNSQQFTFKDIQTLEFKYGNDIDNSSVIGSQTEVLATAVGGDSSCTEERPAIVRRIKN